MGKKWEEKGEGEGEEEEEEEGEVVVGSCCIYIVHCNAS